MVRVLFCMMAFPAVASPQDPPRPRFTVGKATTVIDAPRDADGRPDYIAAINATLGKGVTPATNARVLLWSAMGPTPYADTAAPTAYYKLLGTDAPPKDGPYFIEYHDWLAKQTPAVAVQPDEGRRRLDDFCESPRGPYKADDRLSIKLWLLANEKPLDVVIEATRRPHYYNPLVPEQIDGRSQGLMGCRLFGVQACRSYGYALMLRAAQHVREGRTVDAWADALTLHRLARLLSRGPTLIDSLVAVWIERRAHDATTGILTFGHADATLVRTMAKDLDALPAMTDYVTKVDVTERYSLLEAILRIDAQGLRALDPKQDKGLQAAAVDLVLKSADWDPALELQNEWLDRLVKCLRAKDRPTRLAEITTFNDQILELRNREGRAQGIASLLVAGKLSGKDLGRAIGEIVVVMLLPAADKVADAAEVNDVQRGLLRAAVAVELYRHDHGKYPELLSETVPKYLAKTPQDVYTATGKSIRYGNNAEWGAILWSVGPDGKNHRSRLAIDLAARARLTIALGPVK
jgi:hypothetical protein